MPDQRLAVAGQADVAAGRFQVDRVLANNSHPGLRRIHVAIKVKTILPIADPLGGTSCSSETTRTLSIVAFAFQSASIGGWAPAAVNERNDATIARERMTVRLRADDHENTLLHMSWLPSR